MSETRQIETRFKEAASATVLDDTAKARGIYVALAGDYALKRDVVARAVDALAALGCLDEAVTALERTAARIGDHPDLLSRLAKARHQQENYAAAAKAWERLAVFTPNDTNVLVKWAEALTATGREDDALLAYARVREIAPASYKASVGAAEIFRKRKLYQQAVNCYVDAVRQKPARPRAVIGLCNLLVEFNQPHDTIRVLMGVCRPERSFVPAHLLLAETLFNRGNWMEALISCTTAISLQPNAVAAHCLRGQVLLHLQQPALACLSFETALARNDRDKISLLGLAQAEAHRDNLPGAITTIERLLAFQPEHAAAQKMKAKWANRLAAAR
jgi:protein O-GlcNAc transferase